MFEYSLENGKKQLVGGLILFILGFVLCLILAFILAFVKDNTIIVACSVVFGIVGGFLSVFAIVKIIFGGIVYHAERTSSRSCDDINSQEIDKFNISLKKDTKNRTPIVSAKFNDVENTLTVTLSNGHEYEISSFTKKDADKYQKMSQKQRIDWFYSILIKKIKFN